MPLVEQNTNCVVIPELSVYSINIAAYEVIIDQAMAYCIAAGATNEKARIFFVP